MRHPRLTKAPTLLGAPKLGKPPASPRSSIRVTVERSSVPPTSELFPSSSDRTLYPPPSKEPQPRPKTRHQSHQVAKGDDGDDGLLNWAYEHMQRTQGPKSARDIVDAWYGMWWGHPDKPKTAIKRFKTHHVNRVSKWLERQLTRGLLVIHDHGGKWSSKRYVVAEGCKLRRPVKGRPRA